MTVRPVVMSNEIQLTVPGVYFLFIMCSVLRGIGCFPQVKYFKKFFSSSVFEFT